MVFYLHNFAYDSRLAFQDASAVIVPTEYCRRFYARRIGEVMAVQTSGGTSTERLMTTTRKG